MRPAQPAALRQRFIPAPLALAAVMAIALAAGHAPLAHAQIGASAAATPIAVNIPAQPLGQALNELARQANLQMTFPAGLVAQKQAPAVSGQMTVQQALDRLLASSGLVASTDGRSVVVLQAPSQRNQSATLPEVTVKADADRGGVVTVPYSGGQTSRLTDIGPLGARDVFDTPLSIKSMTSKAIRDRQATQLADIVDYDASISTPARGDTFEYLIIRGFNVFPPFDALYDGLNLPLQGNPVPEFYERTDILKGPGALLFSTFGGVGGSINYAPKIAGETDISELTVGVISDDQARLHTDFSRRFGEGRSWGLRVNLLGNHGSTYQRHSERELAAGSFALDYSGDRFRWLSILDVSDSKALGSSAFAGVFSGVGEPPVPNPKTFAAFSGAGSTSDHQRLYSKAEFDLTASTTTYLKLGRAQNNMRNDSFNGCSFTASGNCAVTPFEYDERFRWNAAEIGLKGNFATSSVRHDWRIAASSADNEYRGFYQEFASQNVNVFDPVAPLDKTNPSGSYGFGGKTEYKTIVLADTMAFAAGQWSVTLGARYIDFRSTGDFDGTPDPVYRKNAMTPMLGVLFKPRSDISIYFNRMEALEKGPSIPTGASNFPGNLKPAVSEQQEIGAKFDFGAFALTAAFFDIKRPNAFLSENTFDYNGFARSRGLELEAFGSPSSNVRILGGVTLLDAKQIKTAAGALDGKRLPGSAKYQMKVGAEWDLPAVKGLTLIGHVLHSSDMAANPDNSVTLPAWTRFDLGAGYQIGQKTTLRFRIENVADKRYWAGADRGISYGLGAPRTLKASLTRAF